MSQSIFLKAAGLYTHPNQLSAPEGALSQAKNVVIDQEGVVSPRRGLVRLPESYATSSHRAKRLLSFQEELLSWRSNDQLAYYDPINGWDDVGQIVKPTGALTIRHAEAASNLLLTSSSGIKVMDSYLSTPYAAGMAKALNVQASTTGASGFMANNTQVAYRVVWGRKDNNENLVLGAPSQRALVSNSTGGTRDVSLTVTIPSTITVTDFIQVYRSGQSATSTTEPNDELYLVYEANPTAGELTARSLTFTDSTPDSLVGATLYTSPSQEGLLQANEQPPLASDLAFFKDSVFYSNIVGKQRLFLTVISVGGTNGIQLDDTITIAGVTYTAKATEDVANRHYDLVTGGTPAQNIADTVDSLVRVINTNSSNTTVYAYVVSGYDDLPGKIVIEERALGSSQFAVTVSARGAAFTPTLPTSGTSVSSVADTFVNGIAVSKANQVEAVPLTNILFAGSRSQAILRLVPLRDSLIILSEAGIYRITGTNPSFQVEQIDSTAILLAPESVAVLNNQVFALTTQGVVAISDIGVQVISRPIEQTLLELQGASLTAVRDYTFGIGYESDRKYMLWTIASGTDTFARQAFVYNLFTSTWTRWEKDVTCGFIEPTSDRLLLGMASQADVLEERKSYTVIDHVDEDLDVTVTAASGVSVTLSSSTGVSVGDLFYESATKFALITAVTGNVLTLAADRGFAASGAAKVLKSFEASLEYVPQTAGNPGILKQWQDVVLMFKDLSFSEATIGFKSELSRGLRETTLTGVPDAGWGLVAWGSSIWGGGSLAKNIRTYVAKDKTLCSQLTLSFSHDCAFSKFSLAGVSLSVNSVSERVAR